MFEVLGTAKDLKSGANIVYCQTTPAKYLEIIGDDFQDFELQRKKENHKAYVRLQEDIKEGALLPSITLAVKHEYVAEIIEILDDKEKLKNKLSQNNGLADILDGLQRTYILKELQEKGVTFVEGQTLLLEYWLEPDLKNIVYRMIVLNSGQKAMSMRHQIDLLFATTRKTIEEQVSNIELFTERDNKKRTSASKYPLSNIAGAYNAFLKSTPEQDGENIVNDNIKNNEIFESSKEQINSDFDSFIRIFKEFKEIDELAWDLYQRLSIPEITDGHLWLGSENVLLGFFAAAGLLTSHKMEEKLYKSLEKIKNDLGNLENDFDYFAILKYQDMIKNINAKKVNIGSARRKYIFLLFKEYFRSEGDFDFSACWDMAVI